MRSLVAVTLLFAAALGVVLSSIGVSQSSVRPEPQRIVMAPAVGEDVPPLKLAPFAEFLPTEKYHDVGGQQPYGAGGPQSYGAPAVVVPAYTAGYDPLRHGAPLTKVQGDEMIRLLTDISNKIGTGGPGAAPGKPIDMAEVMRTECGTCHTPANYKKLGGFFAIWNDEERTRLQIFSVAQMKKMKQKVADKEMPVAPAKISPGGQRAFEQWE